MDKNKFLYKLFPGGLRDLTVERIVKRLKDNIVDGELILDQNHGYIDTLQERIPELRGHSKCKVKWHINIEVEGCE